jgi:diacylglycerol kinase (ATP)
VRVVVVSNSSSGSSSDEALEEVEESLAPLGDVCTLRPAAPDFSSGELAAVGEGDLVVSAGGDGTFNCVVNALGDLLSHVTCAIVPMGTGNDLARTLGVPHDPVAAASGLVDGTERSLDVARASGPGVERLFVNACMGGFPVRVNEEIDEDTKKRFGPLAFWVGGLKAASDLTRSRATVCGAVIEDVVAVGVGNGKTCGGGIEVWPAAVPDDGALDVCAMPAPSVPAAVKLATKVRTASHGELDGVFTSRGPRIEITAEPPVEFNVDGELVGLKTPATFAIASSITMRVPTPGRVRI